VEAANRLYLRLWGAQTLINLRFGTSTNRSETLRFTTLLSAAGALLSCLACSSDSDNGHANYYLSGRVLDGSTLEPISNAEVSLSVGPSAKKTRSAADGSFSVGPIAPDSDYRISAQLTGFEAFVFYGSHLPHLENFADRDRSLVGDVVLYHEGEKSPAFTITASSRDARLPLDVASAEARFVPTRLGVDPALRLAPAPAADAGAEPVSTAVVDTWLPNHALSEVQSYRARIVDGKATVAAGALRWGAGYNLEVYGGPAFEPESLSLAAGRAADMNVWLTPSDDALSTDLAPGTAEYFSGRIYDGVSLDRLTDYSIRLEYFDRVIPGTVDDNGRYFVGPLLANADYSVVVEAEGFRSFLSHNERIAAGSEESLQSLYYDAFLYPEGLSTPGATCRVRVSDSTELPSGFMRFSPMSSSALFDDVSELPVGVTATGTGRQLWENDEDLQQRAFVLPFQNGEVALPSGQLVYGVNYAVTIYGVPAHEAIVGSFVAGVDGDRSWVLDPLANSPLAITALSTDDLAPRADGQLEIRFNQPIAFDPGANPATLQRALNDAFSISSPNTDADADQNVLVNSGDLTPPIAAGYRGVSLTIAGDRLVLQWNRTAGLATTDADDVIESISYAGLGSVMLVAADAPNPTPVALSTLIGSGSSSVQLVAQ
jgi:hypothetical protein